MAQLPTFSFSTLKFLSFLYSVLNFLSLFGHHILTTLHLHVIHQVCLDHSD
ncbi:hypothetical protein E2C01_015548 [Portunus trituberculatus]|uniref:Uncharacterized protein n=1 Tax=Portunus trituberculatus TaxID=210409 RepID=A0A5B7DLU4_PORTR|nr:hypothetical protein [Portunus trituberculatus]